MQPLFDAPASYELPLTLGRDLFVDFQNRDTNGNPLDWPGSATVTLKIDPYRGSDPISADAEIEGSHAVCYVACATTDQVSGEPLWRCAAVLPGGLGTPDTIDDVLADGIVRRRDGDTPTPGGFGPLVIPVCTESGAVVLVVPTAGIPGSAGAAGDGSPINGEVPNGTPNGSTTVFTLAHTFRSGSTAVYCNGLRQEVGISYTESSPTIVFSDAPLGGDIITVDYVVDA